MAVILWTIGLSLLVQGCLCIFEHSNTGCRSWTPNGTNVCCEACHPGNRLVKSCGPKPKELCTPCEPGTFTLKAKNNRCSSCRQCVGAQYNVKNCTATSNTECGCIEGLICGDSDCSFCVKKCSKGYEPTKDRSCRKCPEGTFNDKPQQMCKPWKTKCPDPDQYIVANGNEVTDNTCAKISVSPSHKHIGTNGQSGLQVLILTISTVLSTSSIIVILILAVVMKALKKRRKSKKPIIKTPIIRTPTDDPRTLMAIECSFHEAQQEQGSSSESLDSKNSSDQLIA